MSKNSNRVEFYVEATILLQTYVKTQLWNSNAGKGKGKGKRRMDSAEGDECSVGRHEKTDLGSMVLEKIYMVAKSRKQFDDI